MSEKKKKNREKVVPRCSGCGQLFDGHGLSRWCGVCRPGMMGRARKSWRDRHEGMEGAWERWKVSVLRGRVDKRVFKNRDLVRLGEGEFYSLVGRCAYCGGEGWGLVKRDLGGVWEVGNVLCACGGCGRMKRGLSHWEFLRNIRLIVTNSGF